MADNEMVSWSSLQAITKTSASHKLYLLRIRVVFLFIFSPVEVFFFLDWNPH